MQTLGMDTYKAQNQAGRFFASDVKANVGKAVSNQLGLTTAGDLSAAIEAERNRGFTSSEQNQQNIYNSQQADYQNMYNSQQQNTQNIFQSQENLASQKQSALSTLQNLPTTTFQNQIGAASSYQQLQQQYLTGKAQQAQYSAEENNPWLKLAQSFISTQATNTVAQQGTDTTGQLLGAGSSLGSAWILSSALSDIRLKTNIEPVSGCLDIINTLEPFTYTLNGETEVGLIAQDVEKVLPEAVVEVNGIKMVKLYPLIATLFGAVRELSQRMN